MKLFHYCIWVFFLPILQLNAQSVSNPRSRSGKIIAADTREALGGATLLLKISKTTLITDSEGNFTLPMLLTTDTLLISHVGFQAQKFILHPGDDRYRTISMERGGNLLDQVIVSSGYQRLNKNRTTGSYTQIDSALLNRSISSNILDRLNGVTSGLIFNKNIITGTNQSAITIRSRSTIYSNPNPLIVVDNFPYDGDISTINPSDVVSVTVLKDAAAAAIWGAYSGNGVIVITTKKGRLNQPLAVSFTTSLSFSGKPDLYYLPRLSSSDYISVEQFLFNKGFYNTTLASPYSAISPVVALLQQARNGTVSSDVLQQQLNQYASQDVRRDLGRYFYRSAAQQQYALNFSGGSADDRYYLSFGYDNDRQAIVRNGNERFTVNGSNTLSILQHKLELTTGIFFAQTRTAQNNSGTIPSNLPYLSLVDVSGKASSIPAFYRQSYIDTAGKGLLLDWNYRPLDELGLSNNNTVLTDQRIQLSLDYHILPGLNATGQYQYSKGVIIQQNNISQDSYAARDLTNQFSSINFLTGQIVRPVPVGGILDINHSSYESYNSRFQLTYTHNWSDQHRINLLAGVEQRSYSTESRGYRQYGYNNDLQSSVIINPVSFFPLYYNHSQTAQIPLNITNLFTINRFQSYFANADYTFMQQYTVSGSARQDASNLFGVNTNQKSVPLWSAGLAWELSRAKFYHFKKVPYLRLRATTGYNGNINTSLTAYTTAYIGGLNEFGAVPGSISNPPDPSLRWEKIKTNNIGIDFRTITSRVEGSIEFYFKRGNDLIGKTPIDPTTGISLFTGNVADMSGHGFDMTLHTLNLKGAFTWSTDWLLSEQKDKITGYKALQSSVAYYLGAGSLNPLPGKPVYAVFSLPWGGLDSAGNPQGKINDKKSSDYSALLNNPDLNSLQYEGPANPTFYGSVRNNFNYGGWSLSFNIIYQFGYIFRRPSINYYNLFYGGSAGHPDFDRRWQKKGDELHTYVPSLVYPANLSRDQFYQNASVLIEKGDHVRLQDIRLGYDFRPSPRWHIRELHLYSYINQVGLLWKATHSGIDPEYQNTMPSPRSYAIGLQANF